MLVLQQTKIKRGRANSGPAYLYAKGWIYCSKCEKYYPPTYAVKNNCSVCGNSIRRHARTNKYNKNRFDHISY